MFTMGWDAFGLPTENYAMKNHIHPAIVTKNNIAHFKRQLKSLGYSFDWDREINTTDPSYYKWTQWIFIQLYKHGLAYKREMNVNWCTGCKVVLANEEVVNGVCERCGSPVVHKVKSQWVLKITAYADKLKNWVHDTPFNHIYGSWGFGVSVRMPLFDGYEKRSKMRKAQVDIDNVKLSYQNQMRNMQTQYMNATNDLENSERNYRKQKDNLSLAQNVCNMTNERYKEGIASMTDVLQDEMRITEAQNNYLTAHYNYQLSNLNLLKLTRQLDKRVPSHYDEH